MKIAVHQEGECVVIKIDGYLDFASTDPLTQSLDSIYRRNTTFPIAIDLNNLEFVGSSGVSTFVKSLRKYNSLKIKPTYFGVKSEFVKLFRAFEEDTPFDVSTEKSLALEISIQKFHLQQSAK